MFLFLLKIFFQVKIMIINIYQINPSLFGEIIKYRINKEVQLKFS